MDSKRVTIDSSVVAVEKICKVTESASGPNSLNVMLCTSDGSVYLTKSVGTILQGLNVSDPLERLILNAFLSYKQLTGEDSSNFLIMLHAVLIHVRIEMMENSSTLSSALFHMIAQKLVNEILECMPKIVENIASNYQKIPCVTRMEETIWKNVTQLILTSLEGKFTRNSKSILSDLLVKLLKESTDNISILPKVIDHLISNYDTLCIEIQGKFLSDSQIVSGLLLRHSSKDLIMGTLSPATIVLLDIAEITDSSETVSVFNSSVLTRSITCQSAALQSAISNIRLFGVNLIICSGKIPDNMLYECKKNKISCLSYVDNDDLHMLSELTGTPVFESLKEIRSSSDCLSLATAQTVFLGGNQYFHIPKLQTSHRPVVSPQLIICAPTIKLCHEYKSAILNCLRSIRMSFEHFETKDDKNKMHNDKTVSMTTVKAGGLFEFLVSKFISTGNQEINLCKNAINILKHGLLSIPYHMHQTSYLRKKAHVPLPRLEIQFTEQFNEGLVTCINPISGCLISVQQVKNVEPVNTKITMIFHVFNILLQLSKIDHIVSVAIDDETLKKYEE